MTLCLNSPSCMCPRCITPSKKRIAELEAQLAAVVPRRDEAAEVYEQTLAELMKERDALAAQLAAVTVERDVLRGEDCESGGDGPCGCCVKCLRTNRDALAAENARLRAALEPTAENAKAIALETETRPEANEGYYLEPWEVDIFIRVVRRRAGLTDEGEGSGG